MQSPLRRPSGRRHHVGSAHEIDQILGKTDVEARMLQLQGTPGFVIVHSLVPGALSLDDLEHLVANAKDKK